MFKKAPTRKDVITTQEVIDQLNRLNDTIVDLGNEINDVRKIIGEINRSFSLEPNEKRTVVALLNSLDERVKKVENSHSLYQQKNTEITSSWNLLTHDGIEVF